MVSVCLFWVCLSPLAGTILKAQILNEPRQLFPPTPQGLQPPSYLPVNPPAPLPQKEKDAGNGLEKGVTDPRTGEFYPGARGGVIHPRTGEFLPKVDGGYLNPKTGEVIPKGRAPSWKRRLEPLPREP